MGHLALQFAKATGAWVATTVSADDLDFARELGADQVVNYKTQRFENEVDPVDLVFDLVAGDTEPLVGGDQKRRRPFLDLAEAGRRAGPVPQCPGAILHGAAGRGSARGNRQAC